MCSPLFSLEMNIPYLENSSRDREEEEEDDTADEESGGRNEEPTESDNSLVSKGMFSESDKRTDEKMKPKSEKISDYVMLATLVQICLVISLAIIVLSFLCMLCIYFS